MTEIEIRKFLPDEWPLYRQLRMDALADAPYAFGSTLAEAQTRSEEDWRSRILTALATPLEYPLMAVVDGTPAGLVWGHIHPSQPKEAHLFQMWVDPRFRRHQLAQQMVLALVDWAASHQVAFIELDVTSNNRAALLLYQKCGFSEWGQPHPLRPGSQLESQTMRLLLKK